MITILFSLALVMQPDPSWNAGVAALQAGRAAEAQVLLERACPKFEVEAERGYCLLLLGAASQGVADLVRALESFESSLALLPRQDARYDDARAMAHRYLGELIGSEEHLRHALEIQVGLPDPLLAAATRRRLADVLCRSGKRLDEAEALWAAASAAFRSVDSLPIERVELDAVRARILMQRGHITESRQLFFRVLRAKEAIFGERHQRTIQATLELAAALQAEGEIARAIPLLRRAAWLQKK